MVRLSRSEARGLQEVGEFLDRLVLRYGRESVPGDPVSLVRAYDDPRDREVAGLIASGLAFGGVKVVMASVRRVLDALGPVPARRLLEGDPLDLSGFRHRWISGTDMTLCLRVIARMLRDHGSVEAFLLEGDSGDACERLSSFSRRAKILGGEEGRRTRGFDYFFPEPDRGSAAKRLCLYLRWMVRPEDGIDLGVWTGISTRSLVIPLDTHVHRIARYIGLTSRRTPGWATACEITDGLLRICPEDPVRYDFAIAQLGITRGCLHRRDPSVCPACPLDQVCTL